MDKTKFLDTLKVLKQTILTSSQELYAKAKETREQLDNVESKFGDRLLDVNDKSVKNSSQMSEIQSQATALDERIRVYVDAISDLVRRSNAIDWSKISSNFYDIYTYMNAKRSSMKINVKYCCNARAMYDWNENYKNVDAAIISIVSSSAKNDFTKNAPYFLQVYDDVRVLTDEISPHQYAITRNSNYFTYTFFIKSRSSGVANTLLVVMKKSIVMRNDWNVWANHRLVETDGNGVTAQFVYENSETVKRDLQFLFHLPNGIADLNTWWSENDFKEKSFQLPVFCVFDIADPDMRTQISDRLKRTAIYGIENFSNAKFPFALFFEKDVVDNVRVLRVDSKGRGFVISYSTYLRNFL